MKKTLVALSAAVALFAGDAAYNYELTPTIGGVIPEGNLDLDDTISYGLRLGRNLDGYIFNQLEIGFEHAPNVGVAGTGGQETDITRYFANIVKEYKLTDFIKAYGLVGLGYEDVEHELADNDSSMFGQYGVGLKHSITDALAVKGELRHSIKFDDGDNNFFYTLGLAYSFGKKAVMEAPKPAPMPVKAEPMPMAKPVVLDDDKDGVPNEKDLCPQSAPGVTVDANGCEIDSDKDGVVDSLDQCPNTPAGVKVDSKGCAKTITLHVNFETNKADIKPSFMAKIQEVAAFMKENTIYNVVLEGHTDNRGSEKYNQKLSERRAMAVASALKDLGIDASRVSAKGFGEMKPVADNTTKEGMAQNRRVDAVFNR